jgi:DNA-binding response OmpR family regulator
MKILSVDDKKDILTLIKTILEIDGHDVTDVGNGNDAISACEKNTFDLILLDIMMEGKDGFTTLDFIRKTKRNTSTPIIALTAKAYDSDRVLVLSRGFNDYVAKPFRAADLLKKVAQFNK